MASGRWIWMQRDWTQVGVVAVTPKRGRHRKPRRTARHLLACWLMTAAVALAVAA